MHRSRHTRASSTRSKASGSTTRSIVKHKKSILSQTALSTTITSSNNSPDSTHFRRSISTSRSDKRSSSCLVSRRSFTSEAEPKPKTAIVMLNMGGPEDPNDTQTFLENLFSDPMIINLGRFQSWGKKFAARRAKEVQKQYEVIGGSPIRKWTELQGQAFTKILDEISPSTAPHKHYIAFRYAKPYTEDAITEMKRDGVERAIAFSQYPMYSCTTTGSSLTYLFEKAKDMDFNAKWSVIDRWHNHPGYIDSIVKNIQQQVARVPENELDKLVIMFSAHSLPQKVVAKGDQYSAEVAATVEATMKRFNDSLKESSQSNTTFPHILCWQSKVGLLPWLTPSTEETLHTMAEQGRKHLVVVPVAFTSDHIETLHEIEIEYGEVAKKLGLRLYRSEGLNDSPFLSRAQADIVKNHLDSQRLVDSHQYRIKCKGCTHDLCRTVPGYNENELFTNNYTGKLSH